MVGPHSKASLGLGGLYKAVTTLAPYKSRLAFANLLINEVFNKILEAVSHPSYRGRVVTPGADLSALERDIIVVSVVVAVLVAVVQILIVVIARASRRIGYRGVVIQRSQLSKHR
jgi:uncharacterized membrane protein